jgi:exopolysaccharide biosynthesis polyprenyl glycosylphosphotransferase
VKEQQLIRRFLFFFDLCLIWLTAAVVYEAFGANRWVIPSPAAVKLYSSKAVGFVFLLSILTTILAQLNGLYSSPYKRRLAKELRLLVEAVACAGVIAVTCFYLLGINPREISLGILTVILTWIPLAAWRKFIYSQSISGLGETRNVLIIGCSKYGQLLRNQLDQHPELGYVFKGYVDRRRGGRPPNPAHNKVEAEILGPADQLPVIVRTHFIDEIFVSVPSDRNLVMEVAHYARGAGVPLRVMPDLYEGLATGASVEYLGPLPTMMLQKRSIPTVQLVFKRLVDIVVAGAGLAILSPALTLVAAVIKLDSAGPIFFASLRVGKKGQTFTCFKFRTMVENAEQLKSSLRHLNERDGVLFKIAEDPRLTQVGKLFRKFSIDELPQLWNVLRGDMSLVGPRPPIPSECKQYSLDQLRRLYVTPGLTGLWQVTARQNPSFLSYMELDAEYVNNWSFWLDCRILWKTIGVVFAGTGQ